MSALFARNRLIGVALALVIFLADQWVKRFVVEDLGLTRRGDHYPLLPFFDLTRTNNFGVSLGFLQANSMEMRWALVVLTALIACVVLVWLFRERKLWDIIPLGMILGGAAGNIRDRYLFGYVIDYADFHIGTWKPFLIFNLADAAITVGVVIILARALFMREKPDTEQDESAPETADNREHP